IFLHPFIPDIIIIIERPVRTPSVTFCDIAVRLPDSFLIPSVTKSLIITPTIINMKSQPYEKQSPKNDPHNNHDRIGLKKTVENKQKLSNKIRIIKRGDNINQ